jgi:hypothetical protein
VVFFAAAGVINPAAHAPGVAIGLGVGAVKSNEIIVKLGGEDIKVKLAHLPADSDQARLFLQCLVAKRIVRVDAKRGQAWMLDEVEVNESVRRYLASPGSLDPCDAGRSAYIGPNDPLPVVRRKG